MKIQFISFSLKLCFVKNHHLSKMCFYMHEWIEKGRSLSWEHSFYLNMWWNMLFSRQFVILTPFFSFSFIYTKYKRCFTGAQILHKVDCLKGYWPADILHCIISAFQFIIVCCRAYWKVFRTYMLLTLIIYLMYLSMYNKQLLRNFIKSQSSNLKSDECDLYFISGWVHSLWIKN